MSLNIAVRRPGLASRVALLLTGVIFANTATIFVKASDEFPLLLASYRLLLAALVLSPWFFREWKAFPAAFGWKQLGWASLPAVLVAFNFSSFIVGARMTLAANASLIIGLTPVVMPFYLWVLNRERINRGEILATLFALAGLGVLIGGSISLSRTGILGDLICFGSMLALAGYMALGRRNAPRLSLWLYIVPLYFIAGMICLVAAVFFVNPIKAYTPANLLYALALGLLSTAIGQSLLNYSFKFFRGQIVSVASMGGAFITPVLAYFFLGEIPRLVFYPAAVLMAIGIVFALYSQPEPGAELT